jgi:hypothetical protein
MCGEPSWAEIFAPEPEKRIKIIATASMNFTVGLGAS